MIAQTQTQARTPQRYDGLAERFVEYPDATLHAVADAAGVEEFAAWAAGIDPREAEELYTRTFDVSAVCCLETGWQLFGETYKRGPFLVKLKLATRHFGVECGSEMPDHLAPLLRLLGRLGPEDDALGLVADVIVPALDKMIASFDGSPDNPYRGLLAAIAERLRSEFAVPPPSPRPQAPSLRLPMYPSEVES